MLKLLEGREILHRKAEVPKAAMSLDTFNEFMRFIATFLNTWRIQISRCSLESDISLAALLGVRCVKQSNHCI